MKLCVIPPAATRVVAALLILPTFAMVSALSLAPTSAVAEEEQNGPPPSLVRIDAVIVEPFGQTAPVIGRLVSRQSGVVAARIAGAIARMHVQVGDRVNVELDAQTQATVQTVREVLSDRHLLSQILEDD